jgi:hypothetical protein
MDAIKQGRLRFSAKKTRNYIDRLEYNWYDQPPYGQKLSNKYAICPDYVTKIGMNQARCMGNPRG